MPSVRVGDANIELNVSGLQMRAMKFDEPFRAGDAPIVGRVVARLVREDEHEAHSPLLHALERLEKGGVREEELLRMVVHVRTPAEAVGVPRHVHLLPRAFRGFWGLRRLRNLRLEPRNHHHRLALAARVRLAQARLLHPRLRRLLYVVKGATKLRRVAQECASVRNVRQPEQVRVRPFARVYVVTRFTLAGRDGEASAAPRSETLAAPVRTRG
mmetsp:Transcript_3026/g.11006  ORF Transcript_3026/g.11006 Transcript_3026/m.11006 type:complete len:214 (+) Transcript_3026:350-991(+)